MASSVALLKASRRLLRKSGATRKPTPYDGWTDPAFELFGGVAEGFNTRSDELLLSGPAGTGKTLANLLRVYWVCRKYAGARCLIVRKTRESLTESVLVTWERDILGPTHPILLRNPTLRRVRQSYRFPNRSEVMIGGIDKPGKVLSSEYDVIYVPEATDLNVEDWETLGGRLRSGRVPYQMLIADCNPTSPHHFLYKRCQAGGCRLIPTVHQDNPRYFDRTKGEWTPAGQQYLTRLERMTGARRDRFLKGLWVAAEGVIYAYDQAVHGLPATWKPEVNWQRVWAIDWGKTSPTVLQIWAVDPSKRMYLYKEYFRTNTRPDLLGKWAKEQLEIGAEPRPVAVVCDHDTANAGYLTGFEGASGLHLTLADKADRNKGIEDTQAMFDREGDGLPPRIFFKEASLVHEPDPYLEDRGIPSSTVAEILAYTWDPDFLKDEPIAENDHGCDAMRYAQRWIATNFAAKPIVQPVLKPLLPAWARNPVGPSGWR